jgi:hypothetical protein
MIGVWMEIFKAFDREGRKECKGREEEQSFGNCAPSIDLHCDAICKL